MDQPTSTHDERLALLKQTGFDVYVVHDTASMLVSCEEIRPTTIIIDTLENIPETLLAIKTIATNAELSVSKAILSTLLVDESCCKEAMAANFRDIIPWHLSTNQEWLSRVQFATAPRPIDLPKTLCALNINQPAIVRVPARIIWINSSHMRIECRGKQRVGNTLSISGQLSEEWGVAHINLMVESIHRDKLLYRFSQAIVARWQVPPAATNRALASIKELEKNVTVPPVRIFIAMNRADWRKVAIDALTPQRHEVNVALKRANITSEFTYFSPDVVFFDDRVANSLSDDELLSMFAKIPYDIPLVVFGSDFDQDRMRQLLLGRPIYNETSPSHEAFSYAISRFKIVQHNRDLDLSTPVCHILADHPWSSAELEITARLLEVNPKSGTLSLPFSIGPFGLARLDSPVFKKSIGRNVYIKITNVAESQFAVSNPQYTHSAEFIASDVTKDESKRLSHTLLATAADYYAKIFGSERRIAPHENAAVHAPIVSPTANVNPPPTIVSAPSVYSTHIRVEPSLKEPTVEYLKPTPPYKKPGRRELPVDRSNSVTFDLGRHFDPVIVKALGVFTVAALVMVLIIYAATRVDENSYKDHGKEYTEFFKRMKDPDYSKSKPGSSVLKNNEPER